MKRSTTCFNDVLTRVRIPKKKKRERDKLIYPLSRTSKYVQTDVINLNNTVELINDEI